MWRFGNRFYSDCGSVFAGFSRDGNFESVPPLAIVMKDVTSLVVVDKHAKERRRKLAGALVTIIDARVHNEAIAARHLGEGRPHRFRARGVLPNAPSRTKVEIGQHGGANPEPGALPVALETQAGGHCTDIESAPARTGMSPRAITGLPLLDEFDLGLRNVRNEIVEHLGLREGPPLSPNSPKCPHLVGRRVRGPARTPPANADNPETTHPGEIACAGVRYADAVTEVMPDQGVCPRRGGDNAVAFFESAVDESGGVDPILGLGNPRPNRDVPSDLDKGDGHDREAEQPWSITEPFHCGPRLARRQSPRELRSPSR